MEILGAILYLFRKMVKKFLFFFAKKFKTYFRKKFNKFLLKFFNEGVAKFVDTNIVEYMQSAYFKTMLGISRCPLAPEQLKSLKNRVSLPNHDIQQTEAWAIGILLLTMATLSSEEVIYNWRNNLIDERGLKAQLTQVKENYSPLFYDLVSRCLSFDVSLRPNLSQILTFLAKRKQEA